MKKKLYKAPKVLVKKIIMRTMLLFTSGDRVQTIDTDDGVDADVDYGGGADDSIWDR
ncbi:MAG: hypothetical protein AUK64_2154 [bacterium P201]|nr:MAG: hypothetical protein AUK64_2154 [bacterium P201]